MRTGVVSIQDVITEGYRLTGGFHVSEDQRALASLRRMKCPTAALRELVKGRGIFRGPIFSRIYVDDPSHGEPYVSARDIVTADVRPAAYLSRKHGRLLDDLRLNEGMILVTCSGMNLGSAIWTRREMHGLVASHDLIRIEPDADAVPPGFLFTFLASRYGHALIRKQIYGGHIKHIEPEHIADLPVPRIGAGVEREVGRLTESANQNRDRAHQLRRSAQGMFSEHFSLSDLSQAPTSIRHAIFDAPASSLKRLDAAHHSPACRAASAELANGSNVRRLDEVARVFTPGIFKRMHVEDPKYGYPYFSGTELFQYDPEPRGHLSRGAPKIEDYLVGLNWILIQDAGQLEGLIGRLVRVPPSVADSVVSNHLMRVATDSAVDAAYLSVVLSSPHGYRAITRNAFGSSIPQLDPAHIGALRLPWPSTTVRERIAGSVLEAWKLEDNASESAQLAMKKVEAAIEKGAN